MPSLADLSVKIFADGADRAGMLEMYRNPLIQGFTTNPTLMRKAGVNNYERFARQVLADIPDRPISFEVFSDEFECMEDQARRIATWGPNVFVKIPVTNTQGKSAVPLISTLARSGIQLNVTALFTVKQVTDVCKAIAGRSPAVISVFAGRIADTGRDPSLVMAECKKVVSRYRDCQLLWASSRELLNIFQANEVGCDIITVSNDILKKLDCVGADLDEFSLDTVKMFYQDALKAGFNLDDGQIRRAA
jgi:transaldolase